MAMLRKIGRLFQIKTRFEAWLVIYAIALGAVERGRHYLETYPGWGGWLLAVACTGVVFVAGGKLLDSVRPAQLQHLPPAPIARPSKRRRPAIVVAPIAVHGPPRIAVTDFATAGLTQVTRRQRTGAPERCARAHIDFTAIGLRRRSSA